MRHPTRPDAFPLVHYPPLPVFPAGYQAVEFGTALLGPDEEAPFLLSPVYATRVHMAVIGESGSGKSKLLELFTRHLLLLGEGGMFIDPPGDCVDALCAFAAYRYAEFGDEALVRRLHVLDIRRDRTFRIDPFATLPCRSAVGRDVYENVLDVKAERVVRQLLRRVPVESLEVMNRLRARLKAVVAACGVDLDGRGTHLGLGVALALANPDHRDFQSLLGRAYPHLPTEEQATFREIMGDRVHGSARDKWESTQNALRKVLGGYAKLILEPGRGSLDVKAAVDRGDFILVRLGQSPDVSYDRAVGIGGLVLDALLEAKEAEECRPPHERRRATLIIDEVGDLIGEDLCWALRNDRKFELRMVLGAQNVAAMTRGELNLAQFVLSQCQTVFGFSQKLREDKEAMADRLFGGQYGFTPQMVEYQLQRGYVRVQTTDYTTSRGRGRSHGAGGSEAETYSSTESLARSMGWTRNWSDTASRSTTRISTESQGEGETRGDGLTETLSPIIVGGRVISTTPVRGETSNRSRAQQSTRSDGIAQAEGSAHAEGGAAQQSFARVEGHALALSTASTWTAGESETEAAGQTVKTSLVADIETLWQWTGRYLEGTVADQKERNMMLIHRLGQAECFVSVYGHPHAIPLKVAFVDPLWETPGEAWHAGERIKQLIAAQWTYTFSPSAGASAPSAPVRADDEDDIDAFVDTPLDADAAPAPAPKSPFGN